MGLLYWFRRLYSLETLDTRFTVSSTTPLKAVADSGSHNSLSEYNPGKNHYEDGRGSRAGGLGGTSNNAGSSTSPKWNTLEFYIYYIIFILAVPMMFKTVIDVSRGKDQPLLPSFILY